jgi:hypothetical protein
MKIADYSAFLVSFSKIEIHINQGLSPNWCPTCKIFRAQMRGFSKIIEGIDKMLI